jgi:protease I
MARIAFIVDDLFEDSEFRVPYDRVKEAGHEPVIVGTEAGRQLSGKKGQEKLQAEAGVKEVSAGDFDALVIPGGYSPDKLRMNADMVQFVRDFNEAHKPIAAVCHAGWMLAEANIARGITLTSWPSIKTDLINAGAHWVDREVVVDGNIITSRKPEDLQSFSDALLIQLRGETLPHPRVVPAPSADLREQVDSVGPH